MNGSPQSHKQANNKDKIKEIPNYQKVQRIISLILMALIMTINLLLLVLSIIQIKSSYYDLVNQKCA